MSKTTQNESGSHGGGAPMTGASTQPNAGFNGKPVARRVGLARPSLWAASAISLALGVTGTVAYGVWFNHDQRTYANAIESARRALRLNEHPPLIQTTAGVVLPQPRPALPQPDPRAAPAQQPAVVAQQPAVPAQQPDAQRPASSKRPTVQTRAETPAHTKASGNPLTKIAALFHPASYRRHGTQHQPDALGRP